MPFYLSNVLTFEVKLRKLLYLLIGSEFLGNYDQPNFVMRSGIMSGHSIT